MLLHKAIDLLEKCTASPCYIHRTIIKACRREYDVSLLRCPETMNTSSYVYSSSSSPSYTAASHVSFHMQPDLGNSKVVSDGYTAVHKSHCITVCSSKCYVPAENMYRSPKGMSSKHGVASVLITGGSYGYKASPLSSRCLQFCLLPSCHETKTLVDEAHVSASRTSSHTCMCISSFAPARLCQNVWKAFPIFLPSIPASQSMNPNVKACCLAAAYLGLDQR